MTPYESDPLISIAASLKTIADYAAHLHQQATGERIYEIAGYVRAENNGGPLVHLYASHPGLKYRVGAVYHERFPELPFDPTQGRLYDGEQAPSRDGAIDKGYFMATELFRAAFLPTGATTDAGLPIYRFSRIVSAQAVKPSTILPSAGDEPDGVHWCEWCGDAPSIPGVPCSRCATLGAQPDDTPPPPAPSAHSSNPPIPTPPAPSAHPQPATRITRVPPLAPEALRQWIQHKIAEYTVQRRVATETQVGHVHQALTAAIPDEANRRRFQEWLIGFPSMKEWSRGQVLALHGWLKPSAKNGPTDPFAPEEIAQALAFLNDYVPHPIFVTAQDAIDWAVPQGAFPNPGVAGAAYTARWIEWNRPPYEDMLTRWADYIPTLRPS